MRVHTYIMKNPPKRLIAVYVSEKQYKWLDSKRGQESRGSLIRQALDEKIKREN